jgi:hypothetical protein
LKKIIFSSLVIFLLGIPAVQAQDNSDLFIADMLTLADNFAKPASEGAAYQAGAGWYSSAGTLDRWDFRLSVHGNALFIPQDRKTFSLSNSSLQLLEIEGAQSAELPTAFGTQTTTFFTGEVTFENPVSGNTETRAVRFKGFDGIDRDYVPHAFLQVAVGLPSGTEVTVRGMPEVTIDDVTASTFGLGLKHNFSQYFRNYSPEGFQLAAALTYSKFDVEYAFEPIEVEDLVMMNLIKVDAHLWMAEAIASKQWGAFELFGALGAASSSFDYVMGGDGPALVTVNTQLQELGDVEAYFKSDLGFNLHLGRFRLSAMGTAGKFFNANLGLHVRI